MLLNLLGLGAVIFLAYAFFTLFLKSLRSHHLSLRLLGGLLSGLLTLVFVAGVAAALLGLWRTNVPRTLPTPDIKVTSTPELVSLGRTLAQDCVRCHSYDGGAVLNGGVANWASATGPYGVVYAPNLTPGGDLKGWTDGEVVRAIRTGYDRNGLPLLGHPARLYAGMSDDDATALVAYLRSQPALHHDQPRRMLNLLGWWLVAAGRSPTPEDLPRLN